MILSPLAVASKYPLLKIYFQGTSIAVSTSAIPQELHLPTQASFPILPLKDEFLTQTLSPALFESEPDGHQDSRISLPHFRL